MKCAENEFRIGSTWDRENLNDIPTDNAKKELLSAIPSIVMQNEDFEIVRHSAGVRPCTATTRPHLGVHPKFKQLFSFNGFGSKGYALSPYFAREFADYLDGLKPIDSEADLKRHIKKFYR
jgi:glycine/D-amino acid oxidase-like deaminating enzyme